MKKQYSVDQPANLGNISSCFLSGKTPQKSAYLSFVSALYSTGMPAIFLHPAANTAKPCRMLPAFFIHAIPATLFPCLDPFQPGFFIGAQGAFFTVTHDGGFNEIGMQQQFFRDVLHIIRMPDGQG